MTSSTWPGRLFSLAQGLEAASVLPVGTRVIAVYFSTRRASGSSAGEEEGEEKVLEVVVVVMAVIRAASCCLSQNWSVYH